MGFNNRNTSDLVLVQITDLHIFANEEERFDDVDTKQSLRQVIELIKTQHPDYDLLIATGDLVQTPSPKAYEEVIDSLSDLRGPIFTLPGNHDDPVMMKKLFDQTPLQTVPHSDHGNWRVIYLDSWKANSHSGRLDPADLEALKSSLTNSDAEHILIAVHHHPVSINSTWMDGMMLENAKDLFDQIDQDKRVRGIVWGHIHQQFDDQHDQIKLMGSPSTCAQFEPGASAFGLDAMQAGYRWCRLGEDGSIETGIERLPQKDS